MNENMFDKLILKTIGNAAGLVKSLSNHDRGDGLYGQGFNDGVRQAVAVLEEFAIAYELKQIAKGQGQADE